MTTQLSHTASPGNRNQRCAACFCLQYCCLRLQFNARLLQSTYRAISNHRAQSCKVATHSAQWLSAQCSVLARSLAGTAKPWLRAKYPPAARLALAPWESILTDLVTLLSQPGGPLQAPLSPSSLCDWALDYSANRVIVIAASRRRGTTLHPALLLGGPQKRPAAQCRSLTSDQQRPFDCAVLQRPLQASSPTPRLAPP
jgi:hypothetical protein